MERYVQPFVATCESVFRDFVQLNIAAQTPHFISSADNHEWDISSVIGLTGEAQGAIILSLKKDLAFKLSEILAQTAPTEMDENVTDAVGELINIIAGNVKRDLEKMFRLVISLPTIVQGKNHSLLFSKCNSIRAVCIPFTVEDKYEFSLTVALSATPS